MMIISVMYYLRLIFWSVPRLSVTLAPNFFRVPVLYSELVFFLLRHRGIAGDPELFTFSFHGDSFDFIVTDGSPDVAALIETFVDEEYTLPGVVEPNVIIDVGAHTGNTAWYFHLRFPRATIYAIEASPKNFEVLLENVSKQPNIVPVHCALTGQVGSVNFFEMASSLGSSTIQRSSHDQSVVVPANTLTQFFAEMNIARADVIKIDIEGGEADLFTNGQPEDFADRYVIEVHEDLMGMSGEQFEQQFGAFMCARTPLRQPGRYILDCMLKK